MISNTHKSDSLRIAYFGTPEFAVIALDELERLGIVPRVVVTQPDKPAGRKLALTAPPVKLWAQERDIDVLQPKMLDDAFVTDMQARDIDLCIVAAYGLIISQDVLDIPKYGTLNIHPSLLPQWRGASPLQAALLNDDFTGVTIMIMDAKMDHGPILDQALTETPNWPLLVEDLQKITARQGAQMITNLLPDLLAGNIDEQEQEHDLATFTKKITKADGEIDLNDDAEVNYRKYCAYSGWPRIFFFDMHAKRVVITDATFENGDFIIKKVIPEGKKEMSYEQYKKA